MVSQTVVVFCVLSFTLSVDYSLSLISAEAYWVNTGGEKDLAGLVFGLYDASTILVTPLLAWYIGKERLLYKTMFKYGLIINMIGNLIYAFADLAQSWEMIIVGRGLSGLGACVLPLLMVYVTENMAEAEQQSAVGYIKYVAAISRVLGPVIGSILSVSVDDHGTVGRIFNLYTLVGWIPIFLDIIALYCIYKFFEEEPAHHQMGGHIGTCSIIYEFGSVLVIGFASTFIYWLFMGNSFILATHHFHILSSEHELGKMYATGLLGFILAFIIFMCFKKQISNATGLWLSIILLSLGSYLFMPADDVLFYFSVGLSTFAYGLMIPSLNIFNNNLAKKLKPVLGSKMAISISMLTISQSLARFVGPASFNLFIETIEDHNCDFSDSDHYITSGCSLEGYLPAGLTLISITFVAMSIATKRLITKLNNLEDNQALNNV